MVWSVVNRRNFLLVEAVSMIKEKASLKDREDFEQILKGTGVGGQVKRKQLKEGYIHCQYYSSLRAGVKRKGLRAV